MANPKPVARPAEISEMPLLGTLKSTRAKMKKLPHTKMVMMLLASVILGRREGFVLAYCLSLKRL